MPAYTRLCVLLAIVTLTPAVVDARQGGAPSNEAQDQQDQQALPDAGPADADETQAAAQTETDQGPKVISGMSILGNQEAPTSLVIVPWKSSELGESVGISTLLDDSRQPVDREVFMRELLYYQIRSESRP